MTATSLGNNYYASIDDDSSILAIFKKLSNNGKVFLRKNNSDFVNLNVMYAYRILCQATVCNIQAVNNILALLDTVVEIFFCLYRYGLNSRRFYNGKDKILNDKDGFVTVKMLL